MRELMQCLSEPFPGLVLLPQLMLWPDPSDPVWGAWPYQQGLSEEEQEEVTAPVTKAERISREVFC